MQERDVITLDENLDYLLVKELEFEENKYFLAMGIDEENVYADDHFFLTVGEDEKGEYVEEVEDEELIQKLYILCAAEEAIDEFPDLADIILKEGSI